MAETEEEKVINELLEKTNLEEMLEFETQIFLDILHKDGLVVAAKGLNLELAIINFLKVYCDPGNLVVVLNANESEEKYFSEKINDNSNVHVTTYTTSVDDRTDLYLSGGIHFITMRILVVDMLKQRIPIDKITGFVVLRAHTIFESCQEAFVLRLFRQQNKKGFIKAFSNNAQSFTMGYGHVERVMRALFVKELYIWPRFHSMVLQSLKKHEPVVIELRIPISNTMKKIQSYILELMNITVKELKKINKTVELQEITVENCLTKEFNKILYLQLDGVWHQLSVKSRQLIEDLKTLRQLILMMLSNDPVSFYSKLSSYRALEYAQTSTWVLQEPAESLFTTTNSLLFTGDKELNPELCPKWSPLLEILKVEIPNEIKKSKQEDHKILILCADNKSCYQLQQVLTRGPHFYLFSLVLRYGINFKSISETFKKCELPLFDETTHKDDGAPKVKKAKVAGNKSSDNKSKQDEAKQEEESEEDFKDSYILTMSQSHVPNQTKNNENVTETTDSDEYKFEPFEEMENMNVTQICEEAKVPTIIIQSFKGHKYFISIKQTLEELKPNFIIMYHSNMATIREIEMYEAHRQKDTSLKVYFLIHSETVEEQCYLTSLRREKEAFEHLIKTKSTMVIPEDQDGKSDLCLALQREATTSKKSTRQGGNVEEVPKRRYVIVDMREFRSELPSLIHKRGIDIEPVTITVGDYILTPDVCVERKSLSDLIGSLNSGRLYQQCTQMSRFYSKPMLLIEFDHNKPFSWQSHYMLSNDGNNFDVQQKLILLTLHFPKLKIIWSPSPYASAQLFEELKDGKEEPNVEYAMQIGEDLDSVETKYNPTIYDFVQKLPGITSKNIDSFLRNMDCLDTTITKTEENLKEVLGNSVDAAALYSIIHDEHQPKDESNQAGQKGKSKAKFKFMKKSK